MAMVPSLVSYASSLVDKLNTKSLIWKYFGFIPDDNGKPSNTNTPQCKTCCATVTTKTSNTANLWVHLQQKHPQLYTELMKTSEKECSLSTSKAADKTIKDLVEARIKLSSSLWEHKELTKSVTYFWWRIYSWHIQLKRRVLNRCWTYSIYVTSSPAKIILAEWQFQHYTLKLRVKYSRR